MGRVASMGGNESTHMKPSSARAPGPPPLETLSLSKSSAKHATRDGGTGNTKAAGTSQEVRMTAMQDVPSLRAEPPADAPARQRDSAGTSPNKAAASSSAQSALGTSVQGVRSTAKGRGSLTSVEEVKSASTSTQLPNSSATKDLAQPPPHPPHQPQQQQKRAKDNSEEEQLRLCEQSLVRASSLLDLMTDTNTPSAAFAMTAALRSDTRPPTLSPRQSQSTSTQLRSTQLSGKPSQGSDSNSITTTATTATTTPAAAAAGKETTAAPTTAAIVSAAAPPAPAVQPSPASDDTPVAAAELVIPTMDVEYVGEGGLFDFDSDDNEDDSDSDNSDGESPETLQIGLSASRQSPSFERISAPFHSASREPSTSPANSYARSGNQNNNSNNNHSKMNSSGIGGGGNLSYQSATPPRPPGATTLHKVINSGSLVSLGDAPDAVHTPSSPQSVTHDRLDSVSPVFNGFASANNSRPTSSNGLGGRGGGGGARNGRVDQANGTGLATFFNQPRECASCRSPAVAFACEVCENFFLCEECRFDAALVRRIHDPTHAMLTIQDNHCSSSRTFGGDSMFSLSGDGGASSLFNPPCSQCTRVIDDAEAVYRCEQCDHVLCQECFFRPAEQAAAAAAGGAAATPAGVDTDPPHEHTMKRFQRRSRSGSVHEAAVATKSRSSGGNRVINDYVVVGLLGRGSYAKVKLVQHIRTQELYALKILKKQKKSTASGVNLGRSRVKQASAGVSEDDLLREIAVMRLIDHPNIVKLKEVIEDVEAQKVYVIMEYCENGPVHALGSPPLPLETVRRYGADILRGLLHLHSEFLYHRDVKPANCLVNSSGVVKIADFGTCNSQVRTKTADGTLVFSCPEQVRGEEVSGEVVDSWAFALTLYEMAFSSLPVSTTSIMQHRSALLGPEPIPVPTTGDAELRHLLSAMLEKSLPSRMLLPAAIRHPFFAALQVDAHGAPTASSPLSTAKQQQQQQEQQAPQQQQQPSARVEPREPRPRTELYDKALESVYRGKNLKDCFHGVRALRRIRRKEIETARHNDSDSVGDDYDDEMAFYLGEDDEDMSVSNSHNTDLDSAPRSPLGYAYGSSQHGDSRTSENANTGGGGADKGSEPFQQQHLSAGSRDSREDDTAAAAKLVDETVQHHASSKDSKVEVSYANLSVQSTLEKLNQLSATMAELRLAHNALSSTAGLQFHTFRALKEISISSNRLEAFPEEVLAAPRLVRLDLSHNRIASIPAALATKAPFLERLNLHHNFITYVGTVAHPIAKPLTSAEAAARFAARQSKATPSSTIAAAESGNGQASDPGDVSVLAAPCLRHVRLSGNPLESLPAALNTTTRLQLVLDAIPELMEQWQAYTQVASAAGGKKTPPNGTAAGAAAVTTRLPAVIVWDDSFPVRIPDVEPAVWLAVNNMAVYRVQTLRTCRTRRVVLCQCADPRFPNGAFSSADLDDYFSELTAALQERRANNALDWQGGSNDVATGALPPIVGRAARSYVESYFFVTDDESEEDGGYHSLVEYVSEALEEKEPVLVVVVTSGNTSAVRTNIVAALSTCLTTLRGKDADDISEQAELVVSTMRSLYA